MNAWVIFFIILFVFIALFVIKHLITTSKNVHQHKNEHYIFKL